jgi:hypothetical protein
MSAGHIEPIIYFVCGSSALSNPPRPIGYVLIAPYTDCPTPEGYRREEARYLSDAYELEKKLVQQEREGQEQEVELERARDQQWHQKIRDRLYVRMISSSTDVYEQEFIKAWLQLKDEQKRNKYAQFLTQRQMYLHALHFDTPAGRRVDEEKVSVDRININAG